jgi:tetratricopeptide (TPR) repeat protein
VTILPRQLDDETHARIASICDRGNALAEAGDLSTALSAFEEALGMVPKPIYEWEAATWILSAVSDVLFQQGRYNEARDTLKEAMRCPGAIGNPFIHLRLGQAHFELKEYTRAKNELARAYMGGGDEIFECEVPKYKNYIKEILRPREDI